MVAAAALPIALEAVGTVLDVYGKLQAGKQEEKRAKFDAAQLEQAAGQTLAASQRAALEEERQGRLTASRALAVAAASGGGASDPTIINYMANLAGETNYRKMVSLYEGKEEARQLRTQAEVRRIEGRQARKASQMNALSTVIGAGTSLYGKYG